MNPFLLLAEASPDTLTAYMKLAAGALVGLLSLSGLTVFFIRGFWVKNVEPMLIASVTAWYTHPTQVEARKAETLLVVEGWYRAPDSMRERKDFHTDLLDAQIRRDDGLINREIHRKVQNSAEDLHMVIAEQRTRMDARDQRDAEFQTSVLESLRELQQHMSFLQGRLTPMDSGPPPRRMPMHPLAPTHTPAHAPAHTPTHTPIGGKK